MVWKSGNRIRTLEQAEHEEEGRDPGDDAAELRQLLS
jgi:hypothetical protein